MNLYAHSGRRLSTYASKFLLVMKLTIVLLITVFMQASLASHAQKISYSVENTSLVQVFGEIQKQSGYQFLYTDEMMEGTKPVSLTIRNGSIEEVLKKCFARQPLTYTIKNKIIIVQRKAVASAVPSQSKLINGNVTDDKGLALPGVSVTEKGETNSTITDVNGNYKITVKGENSVLVFRYVGFAMQEIPVGSNSTINVSLKEEQRSLEQVVVVAYGSTTKRNSTGALETVNAKELQDIPAAQFTQKLQGKLSGVQINQTTGKPGQGMQVRIRGGASVTAETGPLYIVDGFAIVGDISNINPNEIETITVLKDAASTALYGSRAAFGVVVITTKNAKAGQTNISANAYTGIQSVPQKGRPDMMTGTEWAQFKKEYYEDLGQAVPAAFQNPAQYGEGYDWYNAMLRSANINDYSVSLNTNKEKFSSSVVAGYFKQEGVLLNSAYNRFSLRSNSLFKVTDKLKVGFNVAPTYSWDKSPATDGLFFGSGGLIYNALLTPPILNYQNPDGTLPTTVTTPGVTAFPTPNWVRSIQDIKSGTNAIRLLSNAYVELEPISKLVLKSSINGDLGQSTYTFFQPATASRGFASAPSALGANLSQDNNKYYSWLSENTASYTKQLNDHGFDLLAGFTVQKYRRDFTNVSGYNYPDDRIQTIDAALVKNNPRSDLQEWSMISYLSRLNYNYKGKYLLGASIRRDGSSRFGINNKWGNFPAVSAGWIVSEESFVKDINWLSFLKLRGSYGIVGNNNIGNYRQYANVSSGINVPFGSTTASGSAVTSLGNELLGWEKSKQLDIGLDLGMLQNRINFTYDYYNKKTSNLLYDLFVPRESGFSTFFGNVGEVKFWGHEFAINSNNLVGKFKWNTNFNIAFSDNKVLALSGLSDKLYYGAGSGRTITRVGGRIGQFWGLVQDGVYKDQADFDSSPKSNSSQVGTIKFRDLNGDGVVKYGDEEGDRTIIGNPFPKFVFGLTNNFSYKKFDLSVVATGSYGNDIARMMDQGTANLDGVFNVLKDVQYRWRSPENPGNGKYGKTTASTGDDRDQFHSRYIQDGSFLTIKNITLGYSLPVQKFKAIKSIRLYSSVQQAFVFTNYGGINPEISTDSNGNAPSSLAQGFDFAAYPVPRTFTFGLNVNLK